MGRKSRVLLSVGAVTLVGAMISLGLLGNNRDASAKTTPRESFTSFPPLLCLDKSAYEMAGEVELAKVTPEEFPGLHNVFHLSDTIISGSEPHGDEALRKLAEMGVKTILSVDGKVPDAETAAELGMRYVHIPIKYNGIPDAESAKIVKTFRELEAPFYVHCFHGKHRGPAAAALGRVAVDGVTREQAIAEMRQWCGTSDKYEGLFRTIAETSIPSEAVTTKLDFDFPVAHPFGGFRQSMVQLPRVFDNLKAFSRSGWEIDPDHPDVDPLNEAAKLADLFVHANTLDEVHEQAEDFKTWMFESERDAKLLKERLAARRSGKLDDLEGIQEAYKGVASACAACHKKYRND